MDSYSSFFSSGLLAPQRDFDAPEYQCPPSPGGRSDIYVDDSDADMDGFLSASRIRSAFSGENKLSVNTSHPRLRKRRSSTALASSPMSAIRSPMRAANSALQVQRHIPSTPTRSRSGSLAAANNIANQNTSLMGRFRSNSTGEILRTRRRRNIPGPPPPMPSLPLPDVPPMTTPVFSSKMSRSRSGSASGKMSSFSSLSGVERTPFSDSQNGLFGLSVNPPMPSFNEADEMKEN